jgi:curli biogenesis system outer membrane secretion channel CsgG
MEIVMKKFLRLTFAAAFTLCLTPFAFGAKPVLAVAEFKNETNVGWWNSEVARDLAGMLTNELASTEKFKLVERSKLDAVLDEQDLAESGRVNKSTGAKVGKLTGAQYIVLATVTAFDEQTSGGGAGLSYRGIGIGGKKEEAYMAVDLRVVDATTGEIEFTRTVEARSTGYGVNLSAYRGGFGGSLSKFDRTPAGKAIRGMVMEISEYLACVMVDQDGCESDYAAKEKSRRDKTKKSIKLD